MAKKDPNDVREAAQKIWMAGLGALKVAEAEGSKLFKRLVEQGEHFEERGREGLGRLGASARVAAGRVREGADGAFDRLGQTVDEKVAETLKRLGVPSRDEIQSLSSRVEELTRAVDRLRGGAAAPAPGRATKTGRATRTAASPKTAASRKAAGKPKAPARPVSAGKPRKPAGSGGSTGGTT